MALTREQIKEAFSLFDADGSGQIDASELKLVLKGIGIGNLRETEIQTTIMAMDTGAGVVHYEEFEKLVLKRMADAGSADEIWKAYQLFDPQETGRISFEDLKRVAKMEDPSIGDDQIHQIMRACSNAAGRETSYGGSEDHTGITFEDWRAIMHSLQRDQKRSTKA